MRGGGGVANAKPKYPLDASGGYNYVKNDKETVQVIISFRLGLTFLLLLI